VQNIAVLKEYKMNLFNCRIKFLTLCAAVVFVLGSTLQVALAQDDPLLAGMRTAGSAKIAIASAPPYAFLAPNGQAQGYMVDVVAQALMGLGIQKLTPTVTTWDAMIPGLQARQFDFVPAGLTVTAARCQVILFSAPVTAQQDALYVLPGNPKKLTGYLSVAQSASARLAALTGSSQEAFALKQGVKPEQIMKVPDIQAGIATVVGGRVDAFVAGQFSVPNASQRGVEVIVDVASPVVGLGIGFRKENAAFRDAFNKQLENMRANGNLRELYATKYGFSNWETLARTTKLSDLAAGCE
jgi:polar amino acid transport system substrate-binding protein